MDSKLLKRFEIHEIDRDYRSWSGTVIKKFRSKEEAEAWCDKESWTGYDYYVHKQLDD